MTRVALLTLGCKANQADTAMIAESLSDADVHFVGPRDQADICVVNTCTVTSSADGDARQVIRQARRASPDAAIVVTGCYAQVAGDDLRAMTEVTHVVGNAEKARLPALLRELAGLAPLYTTRARDWAPSLRDTDQIRSLPQGRTRPFVKVQDGCDYACSFCIIPRARGRNRSLPFDEILETIRRYGALGAHEVVLTGIHVGHFGRDLRPRRTLLDLLRAVDEQQLVPRVRISSIEPNELRLDMLDFAASTTTVCPHFHVPLQSGSDPILRRMRRVYTASTYAALMGAIRARLPHAAIGIDVIVGFPGETREHYQQTVRLLRDTDFTYLHVFPYSPRAGTEAAALPDHVDPEEKKDRAERLRSLSDERRSAFARAQIGRTVDVQLEGRPGRYGRRQGTSENYVNVELDAGPSGGVDAPPRSLVRTRIVAVEGALAIGAAKGVLRRAPAEVEARDVRPFE